MKHRFRFLGEYSDGLWSLTKEDVLHFLRVLKLADGDIVEVTDGKGRSVSGVAKVLSKSKIVVVDESHDFDPKAETPITLALGAIKPADFEALLPSLVELGVNNIWVFHQAGVAKHRLNEKLQARCQNIASSAIKQCKLNWLPEIKFFNSLTDVVEGSSNYGIKLVLDHTGVPLKAPHAVNKESIIAVVGGEAGISAGELEALTKAGFTSVRIAGAVLRARTAIVSIASIIAWNQLV